MVLVGICSMYRAAKFVDNLLDPLSDSFPFHVISDSFHIIFSIFFCLMKWFSPAGDLAMFAMSESPAPSILLPDQLSKQFIAFSLSRPCFLPPNSQHSSVPRFF